MEAEKSVGEEEGEGSGIGKGTTHRELLAFVRGGFKAEEGGEALPVEGAEKDLEEGEDREHCEGCAVGGGGGQGGGDIREEEGGLEEGEDEAGEGGKGGLVQQTLRGGKKTEGAGGDEAEDGIGRGFERGRFDAEVR